MGIKALPIDPFMQDIPWEIIYDDNGRAIGEIFLLNFPEPSSRKRRKTSWKKK